MVWTRIPRSRASRATSRGVVWPVIPPDILGQSGTAWQLFPNFQIGQGLTSALCYSARPDPSYDPDKCIFEVAVFELYPKGEEPQTEWVYTPKDSPNWLSASANRNISPPRARTS